MLKKLRESFNAYKTTLKQSEAPRRTGETKKNCLVSKINSFIFCVSGST